MPRQKYLPHFSHLGYSMGALMLKERAEFCTSIGKCIGFWSFVDNEMANLFSLVLGTESEAALAVFLSLRRSQNQIRTTSIAAKHVLSDPELKVCEALLRRYAELESERNDLAHGCYGICPDDQTILFWISVDEHVHFQTDVLSKEAKGRFDADRHAKLKEKLYVYRQGDFDRLYGDMEEFWSAAFYFNGYLRDRENPGRLAEFQKLCAFPQIALTINQVEAARRKQQ